MSGQPDWVNLRPAFDDDAPSIARIWFEGWCDGHLGHVPDELVPHRSFESFERRAPLRIGDTTVAEVDGEVAGFVMVVHDEVEQVYVDRAFRGRGVAAAVLAEGERQVRAAGHAEPWLAVVPGNARARRFYEREGWVDGGPIDDHAIIGESGESVTVPCRRYIKEPDAAD